MEILINENVQIKNNKHVALNIFGVASFDILLVELGISIF